MTVISSSLLWKMRLIYFFLWSYTLGCQGQMDNDHHGRVGGPCEGCEAIFEFGDRQLSPVDTLPGFTESTPRLQVEGTVFSKSGKPASDVIIYMYHTNQDGLYLAGDGSLPWGSRHGRYRGWVKTDKSGQFAFFTCRPGAYPDGTEPEHIHLTIKEPDKNEYYIESILFDDDPQLTDELRKNMVGRGGSGIVIPTHRDGMLIVNRDIYLGQNIPNYP